MTIEELLPNTGDGVITPCEDESKVPLTTTVDEIATSADKVRLLDDATGVEGEMLLPNIGDEVIKFNDDVEDKVLFSAKVDEVITPTEDMCSTNDPLVAGSELCKVGVKVALKTSCEVDVNPMLPKTCVVDKEALTVILLKGTEDCDELSVLRDDIIL